MIRKIAGVIVGYAIFVVSALMLFKVTGQSPPDDPSIVFAIATAAYGIFFSFIGGFICQLIATTSDLKINYVLALLLAGFAAFSLLKTSGNHWTQLLAIFVFAPATIWGGQFYLNRKDTRVKK